MLLLKSPKHLLILLILFHIIHCWTDFREDMHRLQELEQKCVSDLVNKYFEPESTICVVTSFLTVSNNKRIAKTTVDMVIGELMVGLTHNLMIKRAPVENDSKQFFNFEKAHNYIIFIMKPDDVDAILNMLVKTTSWNPHGNFLIHVLGLEHDFDQLSKHIVNSFWKYFVINIDIISPNVEDTKCIISTWMPFEAESCGKKDKKIFNIANHTEYGLEPMNVNIFPQKFPSRLNNCPIRAIARTSPPFVMNLITNTDAGDLLSDGLEITMLKTIAKKREFNLKIT